MNMKQCTKCGESKTTDEFSKSNQSKDGLAVICKKCKSEYDRARRASKKQCSECGRKKPVTEFHKNPSTKDGLQCACKRCLNERSRIHYHAKKALKEIAMADGVVLQDLRYSSIANDKRPLEKQKPQNLKIHAAYLSIIAFLAVCTLILLPL